MTTAAEAKVCRVLVADDHALVRDGICELLGHESDLLVVAAVADGRAALEAASAVRPDVAILDVRMPGLNGIETARELKLRYPEIEVICMSINNERQIIDSALAGGASGYILKGGTGHDFADAVRAVAGGEQFLSAAIRD